MTSKSIIYYTDNRLAEPLYSIVQKQIFKANLPIYSASLKPIGFGYNVIIHDDPCYPTMVEQIIAALEASDTQYVFFTEHDVLYDPSHFDFIPPRDDIFYYNINIWRWWLGSKKVIQHDRMMSLSSLCVNREFVLDHYRRRQRIIEQKGWDQKTKGEPSWARAIGYEPGTKKRKRGGFSDDDFDTWKSAYPNVDVRHEGTYSRPKVALSEFKHPPKWWREKNARALTKWKLSELL